MAGKKRANGEGTLFRRSDGIWVGRITLPDGRVKQVAAKSQAVAKRKLQEARVAVAHGLPVTSDRETVGEFLQRWLADSIQDNRRRNTYAGYEGNVRLHIVPYLGRVPLARLTPQDVQGLMNTLREKELSPREDIDFEEEQLRVRV